MLLELRKLNVPPGQRVLLQDLSWREFEEILEDLGEHRAARVAYDCGTLEIMTPLPEHEYAKEIVGDLIKALLEELNLEFCSLGSSTFKNQLMSQGIEPDQCFYIQNELAVRGKQRLDLAIDPPPDLAIEIDLTSRTHSDIYLKLRVPELWRFEQGQLKIAVLRSDPIKGDSYADSTESPIFPGLELTDVVPRYLLQSRTIGRNIALKAFRQWVRTHVAAE